MLKLFEISIDNDDIKLGGTNVWVEAGITSIAHVNKACNGDDRPSTGVVEEQVALK